MRKRNAPRAAGDSARRERRPDGLEPAAVIERVDELLEVAYRSGDLGNQRDILSESIYILLSRQTREATYQDVYKSLRERFPRWLDVLAARTRDLERVLRPAGLQTQRRTELKGLLRQVKADNLSRGIDLTRQDLTLEYLREDPASQAETFLLGLPGIGPKSARCITMYSLDRQDFPVDTHVARVFDRLGLVTSRGKPSHELYEAVVPRRMRRGLHINIVHHGRAVCRSRNPQCGECHLISFCEMGRARVSPPKRQAVDLFAGCGGLGLGFRQAGFGIAVAVESDAAAAQTYRSNHPGTPVLEADVADVTARKLRAYAPALNRGVAMVIGGPPCQGYSAAGPREPCEERNYLYKHLARVARELKSSGILIENVPGTRRVRGVDFARSIREELSSSGFVARSYHLYAPDFGVPQNRERVFFVGLKKNLGISPTRPRPTHSWPGSGPSTAGRLRTSTLSELMKHFPERQDGVLEDAMEMEDGTVVYNAATMAHAPRVIRKISEIPVGSGPLSYRRLDSGLAATIIAGHRALPVHPWLDRTISVREAASIQGFPLSYVFCGSRSRQPLQVANAVPPPVALGIAAHLSDLLEGAGKKR